MFAPRHAAEFICALATAVVPAHAYWEPTIIGSSGAPDEGCKGAQVFTGAAASLAPDRYGTCTLRYPLHGMDATILQVTALLMDNGFGSRVRVRMRQLDLVTGETFTLSTIDSDTRPGSPDWQTRRSTCNTVDWQSYAYWLEVDLNRSARGGKPSIAALQVRFSACDGPVD